MRNVDFFYGYDIAQCFTHSIRKIDNFNIFREYIVYNNNNNNNNNNDGVICIV